MFRRAFLSRFTASAALLGIGQAPGAPAPATASAVAPLRHPQDAWLDERPGGHKVVFDTYFSDRFSEAVGFAGNFIRVNKDEYGLTDADLAVVLVVRHGTAPFAFNQAMWTKYGTIFAAHMSGADVKAHPNPTTNVYAERLATLVKQGLQLAVCSLTTRAYTRMAAEAAGGDADAIYKELTSNTLGNAHFVPAGVVAVTRAQEHGYALVSVS